MYNLIIYLFIYAYVCQRILDKCILKKKEADG